VALVTIVAAQGSTPQRVGAKMLVYPDGRIAGTIGGGCYENDALGKAREALLARKPRLVKYDLTDDFAEESGLICGGQMTVYIEPVEAAPQLYIVGAGHVGHQLAKVARPAGFRIHVLDDREKFANAERFPEADEITSIRFRTGCTRRRFRRPPMSSSSPAGHRHDLDALRSLAARDLRYLGLIGSKAKVKKIYDALIEEGMPLECLSRVHAPIGLDIGAVTPEEIAISILAELIAVRRGRMEQPTSQPRRCSGRSYRPSLAKE
jgi:xanthine dehydrogenase accessory factor